MITKSPYGFEENVEALKIQLECFRQFPLGKEFLTMLQMELSNIPLRKIETREGKTLMGSFSLEQLKKINIKNHTTMNLMSDIFASEYDKLLFQKLCCVYFWNIIKLTLGFDDESIGTKYSGYANKSELFLEQAWYEHTTKNGKYVEVINKKFFSLFPHLKEEATQGRIGSYLTLFIRNTYNIVSNYFTQVAKAKDYQIGRLHDEVNDFKKQPQVHEAMFDAKAVLNSRAKLKSFIIDNKGKSSREIAAMLSVGRSTLFRKTKKYGIKIFDIKLIKSNL